jgi:hypothetical protein
MKYIYNALHSGKIIKDFLLIGDGIALALHFVVAAKARVESRDFVLCLLPHRKLLLGSRFIHSKAIIPQNGRFRNAR